MLLVIIMTFSIGSIVFAEKQYSQEVEKTKPAKVTENNFYLTKAEQEKHKAYQKGLIECIKKEYSKKDGNVEPSDVEKALVEYNSNPNTTDPVVVKIEEITGMTNSKDLAIREEKLIDEGIIKKYSKAFSINEKVDVVVTPTTVYLDELEIEYYDNENSIVNKKIGIFIDTAKAASKWKTVSVATRSSLFTSTGKKAASVHTGGKIQYNG